MNMTSRILRALVSGVTFCSIPSVYEAFSQSPPISFRARNSIINANLQNDYSQTLRHKENSMSTSNRRMVAIDAVSAETEIIDEEFSSSKLRYNNRPIVLIGCSGANNEIPRLASALVDSLSYSSKTSTDETSEISSNNDDNDNDDEIVNDDNKKGGVVELIHSDADGDFVLAPIDIKNLILGEQSDDENSSPSGAPYISGQDVIVLDYAHPHFRENDEEVTKQLTSTYNDIIKVLYEELKCLCIYINVQPDSGEMEDVAKQIRENIEDDIFIRYTDYEVALKDEGLESKIDEWGNVEWELNRIVARAYLPRPIPGEEGTYTLNTGAAHSCNDAKFILGGQNTFFLSLSFPVITHIEPYVASLCKDNDSMEFRADLLTCRNDRHAILHSQFRLRSMCRKYATRAPLLPFGTKVLDDTLPMVYTVRTAHQAGTWPDETDKDIEDMFDLLRLGVRGATEVLDVESAWNKDLTNELLTEIEDKYSTLVLGSHHVVPDEISVEETVKLFQQCGLNGRAHGAKVVVSIQDPQKDGMAYDAAKITQRLAEESGDRPIPAISLVLGEIGVRSRILNDVITPVTHPALPFKAAPGQLSSEEIMENRVKTGMVPVKEYAILGHNIAYSVSPQMQGGAFEAVGLPHKYGRADVETIEEFISGDLWNSDNFGGCSVTIPHKQTIIPHVDIMSDAANTIGSVNTITIQHEGVDKNRVVYGDNTDWRGIFNPLQRRLSGKTDGGYVLIIGGGGTARAAAYAAQQLGLKRIFYNRTTKKAEELVETFGGVVVTDLSSGDDEACLGSVLPENSLQVVISTLPASVGFELPAWILSNDEKPVIFDVNYKPYWTKLLHQADDNGCDFVRGSEMLWEQGVGQFEIWTGRCAPYKIMKDAVLSNCLPEDEQ